MARILGETEVVANGTTYRLRFDWNVIADIEEALDIGIEEIGEVLGPGAKRQAKNLRTVCRLCLRRHHPDATDELAGDLLSEGPEFLMDLITSAMPQDEDGPAAGKLPRARDAAA